MCCLDPRVIEKCCTYTNNFHEEDLTHVRQNIVKRSNTSRTSEYTCFQDITNGILECYIALEHVGGCDLSEQSSSRKTCGRSRKRSRIMM